MANETTDKRFTEALESITNVVNTELTLIDLDAQLQTELPEGEFAARDKELFLASVRSSLERVISDISDISRERWQRVEEAFSDQFPPSSPEKSEALGGETQCPPGFINVDGICVPI
ncbi:MAG TPA: hypothetical protein VGO50_02360 [Pyrinomonadaceae bacterium]|jgi:hypothetical protein|nr:hypothetical protein [Pyrinomonadaceae bacterium]